MVFLYLRWYGHDRYKIVKDVNVLDYKIDVPDIASFLGQFRELFVDDNYKFTSKSNEPVIYDCGANIGFSTIFFKWIYSESEIYAFEPDKITFEILKKNVLQNKLKNVYLFNNAISDKNGKIDFFVDLKSPGSLLMSTKQERMPKEKVTVNCISLSSFIKEKKIPQIDFFKMDIEGSEKEAIQDLDKNNQLNKIIKLVIEYHHNIGNHKSSLSEFLQIFEKNGFEYQIDARNIPINDENTFQDVLLYLYK